jgi:hypothetical protein
LKSAEDVFMSVDSLSLLAKQINKCLRKLEREALARLPDAVHIGAAWEFSLSAAYLQALVQALVKDPVLWKDVLGLVNEAVASESWRTALRGLFLQRLVATLQLRSKIQGLQVMLAETQTVEQRQASHHSLESARREYSRLTSSGSDGRLAQCINDAIGILLMDSLSIKALTLIFSSNQESWQSLSEAIERQKSLGVEQAKS